MKYLILSDIHANLESLTKIIDNFISEFVIDEIICLGDIVGYNANPAECVTHIFHTIKPRIIRGNHDRAIAFDDFKHFSDHAKASGQWTRKQLSTRHIEQLAALESGPGIIDNKFAICHGSPVDEDEYILSSYHAIPAFLWLQQTGMNILFFGHTHIAESYICDKYADFNDQSHIKRSTAKSIRIKENEYYCINPGSLGQPRDNNPHAAFAVFDTIKMVVDFIRFPYKIEKTREKIMKRGVPYGAFLASRLLKGE